MARVVVVGDVGGHPGQLRDALSSLGADVDRHHLPEGMTVVQVGDLVDRGPDSRAVLAIVRGYLENQPERWIQLVGNHESQYLPGGAEFWPERLDDADADLLRSWWAEGRLRVAVAIRTADGDDLLVTHAGLTVGAWRELAEPPTAAIAARLLNERPQPLIFRGGEFGVDRAAGPFWAEAGWELHEPWLEFYAGGGFVPFGQVHGHSQPVRFADRTWRCPGRVRQRATVDWSARHVRVRVGGRVFTAIDPKHGRTGAAEWTPLILDGAELLTAHELPSA
ncbi:metallophosphoesterase [Plantactinospora sp. S1510]|uniref:Metallophosphoesterase n=1 Tax=Plantactinospora alkalitolerans TaxID=2789879 RepID=A0ABS0H1G2_9ACTN|nr:metallophosphoesterase [Plantactinospora alkalitolerans]MBF9132302.1 metallophosphoesterase [Plantactinospora alkalitolerans]